MPPDRYAVIGDPVAHSLSPAMHNAAFRAAGIDGRYEALAVAPQNLRGAMERLRTGGFKGLNVTVPHKQAVGALVDHLAPAARAVGAVNTIVIETGTLSGHNTDVEGFDAALQCAGIDVRGERAVVFGTGGAARAVLQALALRGAQSIVVSRSSERARRLAAQMAGSAQPLAAGHPRLRAVVDRALLVVNATPLGMDEFPARSPLPAGVELTPPTVAFDLVYGRRTPFLEQAAGNGCLAVDGLEMLVRQGAASFGLWTGTEADIGVMRAACIDALRERQPCSAS